MEMGGYDAPIQDPTRSDEINWVRDGSDKVNWARDGRKGRHDDESAQRGLRRFGQERLFVIPPLTRIDPVQDRGGVPRRRLRARLRCDAVRGIRSHRAHARVPPALRQRARSAAVRTRSATTAFTRTPSWKPLSVGRGGAREGCRAAGPSKGRAHAAKARFGGQKEAAAIQRCDAARRTARASASSAGQLCIASCSLRLSSSCERRSASRKRALLIVRWARLKKR
eukprot:4149527-Pleurochrysis_carterae.AAC.2